ncbi:TrmH family RNA methyltransferase [Microvirga makkahensis]|uniref:23S rRNA (Guanosine(2251)-2'-O)-methyltransferase RlmB n=1 Tax=Microvirga makkahensis TaxID=1128670 RepID=A0A7X3SM27_9HYPH|nr:RNA methyltransferase [Microvirga makkahensis]MXQ09917.1 23S rRNA (guanosine(2251)-2'-O)-methyltransferase RlmB [Microvirga makkahensis]
MSERPFPSRKPRFQRPQGKKQARRESQAWRPPHEIDTTILYGWHPVVEALRNRKRTIRRLLTTENSLRRLQEELGTPLPLEPEMVRPDDINRLLEPDAVHQGLYAEADPLPSPSVETLSGRRLVLALDQITDPHNVGAIVRTAAAFDVEAIITTARHSPAATGVLAKSASGGLEHVPFMIVKNLGDTLTALGERGFQRIGLDSEGEANIDELPLRLPLVLVLGSEGKGLRQRTRECCDVIGRLDMPGEIKSLNVSNAAAISLFAVTKAVAQSGTSRDSAPPST